MKEEKLYPTRNDQSKPTNIVSTCSSLIKLISSSSMQ